MHKRGQQWDSGIGNGVDGFRSADLGLAIDHRTTIGNRCHTIIANFTPCGCCAVQKVVLQWALLQQLLVLSPNTAKHDSEL